MAHSRERTPWSGQRAAARAGRPWLLTLATAAAIGLLASACHEEEYERAWTRALVARGLPDQAIEHYARLSRASRESVTARGAVLEAYVERAGFKPLVFMTSLRGILRSTPVVYREGSVPLERQAEIRKVLARAEELTRPSDTGTLLLLGGGTRLILALCVTKEEPALGAPSVLSALEYVAATRDPGLAAVGDLAQTALDRIAAGGGDRERALLAWLEAPADE